MSSAILMMFSEFSNFRIQCFGMASFPCKVPNKAPVIDPVESLSPEWLTAASTPFLKSFSCISAQYSAMANASSPTHPPPNS